MSEQITVLPGDGIGPEVMQAALSALDEVGDFEYRAGLIGGAAMDVHDSDPFPPETEELVKDSRVVLLGAVGGPQWESPDPDAPRPEDGLLKLRKTMGTYAGLRPVIAFPGLEHLSPFRAERIRGVDFVIVREMLGGSYYGDSGREGGTAHDMREYSAKEIEAVARVAFELAIERDDDSKLPGPHVTSVDKANVLETSRLWREVVTGLHEAEYQEVELEHMYVDNAAFQLGMRLRGFDVVLTENEHGDILSDEMALVAGSLGVLPSATVTDGEVVRGIFEPVHGSAPDIAGQGKANPSAMLLSTVLMLHVMDRPQEAGRIKEAVFRTFERGILTPELGGMATTQDVTEAVISDIRQTTPER